MSLHTEQMSQVLKTLQAMKEMLFEAHGGCSEATQAVEYELSVLEELMTPVEITVDMVKELRQNTGEGMLACKSALYQARGDMLIAVDILRNSGNI